MESNDFLGCSRDIFNRNLGSSTKFCSRENWQSAVLFLSQELELSGLSSPCVKTPGSEDAQNGNLDIIAFVNITWELLQNYRSCLKTIENLESHIRRKNNDVDHLQSSACRQKDLLEIREREAFENSEKERKSSLQVKSSQQKLRLVKEEVRRLTNVLIQRESRYNHETKKKDQEIMKLKERLVKILADKTTKGGPFGTLMGIDLSSQIPKPEGKLRGRWSSEQTDNKRENELFKRIIQDFELKNQNIIKENLYLRHFVSSMIDCFRLEGFSPVSPTSKLSESFVHSVEAQIRTDHEKGDDDLVEATNSASGNGSEQAALNRERSILDIEKKEFSAMKEEFLKEIVISSGEVRNGDVEEDPLLLPPSCVPQWSQGTASYTVPSSELKKHSQSGVHIGPPSGSGNITPTNSGSSSRNPSRASSREGSGSRGDIPSARRHSGAPRRNTNRPRSTNLSPVSGIAERNATYGRCSTSSSRDGSLSPTTASAGFMRVSRSLPRIQQQKRRSLHCRMSPSTDSDAGPGTPPLPPIKPPSGVNSPPHNSVSRRASGIHPSGPSPDSLPRSDELSAHLYRLGEYIERKERNQELSESEMEFHLENVRKAMNIANRRMYSSSEDA